MDNDISSSNINEIMRAVLSSVFFFFYEKISHAPAAPKSILKHKNATKQKHKTQISKQKLKMRLENIWVEKSNLFAFLHFLCTRRKK